MNDKIMYLIMGALVGAYLSKSGMIGRGWELQKSLKEPPTIVQKAKMIT